jgi:predicted NUDIX family phosphoesterase
VVDKSREQVLVIPAAVFRQAGIFEGFSDRVDYYLSRLLEPRQFFFRPRVEVEQDPTYKQIIPYVALQWRDQLFHYTRGKRSAEARLQALRSVGVGGHICDDDRRLFDHPYREGMFREVAEEVEVQSPYTERCIGLINDDSTPVGRVHLGIVHLFELEQPRVRPRERALTQSGFAPLSELLAQRAEFETWSRIVLDALTCLESPQP